MAEFKIAEAQTGKFEGLYANNPADKGGETYAGIARNFWPKWSGWKRIDEIKRLYGKTASVINKYAKDDIQLHKDISLFYKANFWDANKLDKINDQQIANTVYDFGVNAGVKKAAKTLQEVQGLVNDGIVGNKTLAATNSANPITLHAAYNCKRKEYYMNLATNPTQQQFLKGWLNRLKTYKS